VSAAASRGRAGAHSPGAQRPDSQPRAAPTAEARSRRLWARAEGVSLHELAALPEAPALRRALADGVERGYDGPLPALPTSATLLLVRAEGADVGVLAFVPGPGEAAATLLAVAVAHEARGRSLGLRAVLAAERRLGRDGVRELYASVPRGNGRGVYFWLRAGYRPLATPPASASGCAGDGLAPTVEHGGSERGCGWFYRRLVRSRRSRR
jgi:GNAT superfamily N-acetyltransferase